MCKRNLSYLGAALPKATAYGVVGGFIGAIVMGALAYLFPIKGEPFFILVVTNIGISATVGLIVGWVLNLIAGIIIGAIFGYIVGYYHNIRVSTYSRGLVMGLLAGGLVWAWFFMPVIVASMPTVSGLILAEAFGGHIVFGLIMGAITAAGTRLIVEREREPSIGQRPIAASAA